MTDRESDPGRARPARPKSRRGLVIASAALATALAVLWMPIGLIETVVASSGLSEAAPAAAPPLGMTARLTIAAFVGLMAAGVTELMVRPSESAGPTDYEKARPNRAKGAKTMGFAFSKLTALARGRVAPGIAQQVPALRRADAHPDAPPRPPIFASRDFDGLDVFGRTEGKAASAIEGADSGPAFLRPAPFAAPAEAEEPAAYDVADDIDEEPEALWAPAPLAAPERPMAPLPLRAPTHDLSVRELTERLERGLALRARPVRRPIDRAAVIADMPPATPQPVRESVEPDTDEALRAALGALRSMAGRR